MSSERLLGEAQDEVTEQDKVTEDLLRNGSIPSWADVAVKFRLNEFHPRDQRLLMDFYRGHRRLAQGKETKGKNVFRGLFENPDFLKLESTSGSILSEIVSFVRRGNRRRSQKFR